MCSDQSPWAINDDLAYGFAAVSASSPNCCSCYQLTFTSTVLSGKKMIVQATNTGDDVGSTQFDLAVSLTQPSAGVDQTVLIVLDTGRWIRTVRWVLDGVESHVSDLGSTIRWTIYQYMLLVPQSATAWLWFPLGLDARC